MNRVHRRRKSSRLLAHRAALGTFNGPRTDRASLPFRVWQLRCTSSRTSSDARLSIKVISDEPQTIEGAHVNITNILRWSEQHTKFVMSRDIYDSGTAFRALEIGKVTLHPGEVEDAGFVRSEGQRVEFNARMDNQATRTTESRRQASGRLAFAFWHHRMAATRTAFCVSNGTAVKDWAIRRFRANARSLNDQSVFGDSTQATISYLSGTVAGRGSVECRHFEHRAVAILTARVVPRLSLWVSAEDLSDGLGGESNLTIRLRFHRLRSAVIF